MKKQYKNSFIKFVEWMIYMIAYALILISISVLFKNTIQIDNHYFGFWALAAAIIINILNRTIKPVIVWLTIPITAITLGVFYPFINVLILHIVDFILGSHFSVNGIFLCVIVAILISVMNMIMDNMIIKPLLERKN